MPNSTAIPNNAFNTAMAASRLIDLVATHEKNTIAASAMVWCDWIRADYNGFMLPMAVAFLP